MITICLFCRRRKLDDGTWIIDDPVWVGNGCISESLLSQEAIRQLDRCYPAALVKIAKERRARRAKRLVSHVTCPDCKAAGRRMDEQQEGGIR